MDQERRCTACGASLVGPMGPQIMLISALSDEEAQLEAWMWMCAACGLVHWYGDEEDLPALRDVVGEAGEHHAVPGTNYERRAQVSRMLRRVRRM